MAAYTAFTITTTAWRTKFRKAANAADNKGATVAVDSLINYEAVKVSRNYDRVFVPVADGVYSTSTMRSMKQVATTLPCGTTRTLQSRWQPRWPI